MFGKTLKGILGVLAVLLIAASIFLINLIWFRPWSLNLFYEKIFAEVLFDEPELLSSLGLVEQFGITKHNGELSDESPAHQQKVAGRWRKDLEDLHKYPLSRQTESQRLSTHVLDWFLQRRVEGEKYQWHDYPVNQLHGVQSEFPSFMANTHRLLSARDCDYYLQRLDALPKKFDQMLESLKLREEKQILPPRFVVEEVLKEMEAFVAQAGGREYFLKFVQDARGQNREINRPAARRLSDPRGSGDDKPGLSGVSKTDRLFHGAPPQDNDG